MYRLWTKIFYIYSHLFVLVSYRQTSNTFALFFLPHLILQFELCDEFVATEASDKFSLHGGKIIKSWWIEDVFVARGSCNFIQFFTICIRNSNCQDADPYRDTIVTW